MEKTTIDALNKIIDEILQNNRDKISEKLLENTDSSMSSEKLFATMMLNCVSQSTKIAAQVVLDLFQSQGALHLDEREIAKQLLKQLSSEIKE